MTHNSKTDAIFPNLTLASIVILLSVVAFLAGVVGNLMLLRMDPAHPLQMTVPDALYRSLQLFILNGDGRIGPKPLFLEIARFLAPIATAVVTTVIFFRQLHQLGIMFFAQTFWKDHLVICGLDRKGMAVARNALAENKQIIVIEISGLSIHVASLRALRVPVIIGDASEHSVLKSARTKHAKAVFISCGDDDNNVRIALNSMKFAPKAEQGRRLIICPHLVDSEIRSSLRDRVSQLTNLPSGFGIDLNDISQVELAASSLLAAHPLDHRLITADSDSVSHLILIGFGRTGQAVFRQALKIGHYPNRKPLRVSIFDSQANRLWEHFVGRFPNFASTALPVIAEVTCHESNVFNLEVLAKINRIVSDSKLIVTIAICLDSDSESMLFSGHLPLSVAQSKTPVLVHLHESGGIAELISSHRKLPFSYESPRLSIYAFGQITEILKVDTVVDSERDVLAKAIHEEYLANYRPPNPADWRRQNLPWHQLDESFRDSNRQAADFIPVLFRSFGYKVIDKKKLDGHTAVTSLPPEQLLAMAETEHARWYAERYLGGWSFATTRDDTKMLHDCMLPWTRLTDDQKKRDITQVLKYVDLLSGRDEKWGVDQRLVAVVRTDLPKTAIKTAGRALISDNSQQFLVIRRAATVKFWAGLWELPGGKPNPGESFEQTLIRETFEETNLRIQIGALIGTSRCSLPHVELEFQVVRASIVGGTLKISSEHSEAKWVSDAELRTLNMVPAISSALGYASN